MNKLQFKLLDINTETEVLILVKRVKRSDLNNFLKLNRALLEEFVFYNGSAGTAIADNKVWDLIKKISKIVPLIPTGYLSDHLDLLEENLNIINSLFFSASWDLETGEFSFDEDTQGYKASLLYQLNDLDYQGDVKKGVRNAQVRIQKEEEMEQKRMMEALSVPSETSTNETATS